MRLRWDRLGGQLGIGLAVAGFLLVFLGWNGAASYDRVPAQFPYLISGGVAGLCLVILGAAMVVVQNARQDRAQLQETIAELRDAVERLAAAQTASSNGRRSRGGADVGLVVAGPSSFHRPDCRLLSGRTALTPMTVAAAEEAGLSACRVCSPAAVVSPR